MSFVSLIFLSRVINMPTSFIITTVFKTTFSLHLLSITLLVFVI